jgi:hypothetical protein
MAEGVVNRGGKLPAQVGVWGKGDRGGERTPSLMGEASFGRVSRGTRGVVCAKLEPVSVLDGI